MFIRYRYKNKYKDFTPEESQKITLTYIQQKWKYQLVYSPIDELVLKISAIVRRLNINKEVELTVGNLVMNKEEHMAYIDGEELTLTVREFEILYCMLSYPKKTFTRGKLMEDFWDFDSSATSRTVDVYMAKLRDKTKKCTGFEIQTVHGLGYKVVLK